MERKTVNLGKARIAGRQKRAKKAVALLKEKLGKHREGEVKLSSEVNQEIWKNGAKKPPAKITVKTEEDLEGNLQVELAQQPGTQKTQSTREKADYEEIVEGTVAEVKEKVKELDNPDYDKLEEAEKQNKDRKSVEEFIENQK